MDDILEFRLTGEPSNFVMAKENRLAIQFPEDRNQTVELFGSQLLLNGVVDGNEPDDNGRAMTIVITLLFPAEDDTIKVLLDPPMTAERVGRDPSLPTPVTKLGTDLANLFRGKPEGRQGRPWKAPDNACAYTTIKVLPSLIGKPWDDAALCMVTACRPTQIRVIAPGEGVQADFETWRVTVSVDGDGLITNVRQEVGVWVPKEVENGWHLECILAGKQMLASGCCFGNINGLQKVQFAP